MKHAWQSSGLVSSQIHRYTPTRTKMETLISPRNEKENHLPNLHSWVPADSFRECMEWQTLMIGKERSINFCQQITSHLHRNSHRFCAGRILPSRVRFIFTATHSPQAPPKCNKGNPTPFEWPIFQFGTLSEFVSLPPPEKKILGLAWL